jgi:hypothetical protein
MVATYSPEGRLLAGLRELNCAGHNFARISGIISKSRLAEALNGDNDFDNQLAERLLSVLSELKALQAEFDCPIDFSRVREIELAIHVRRAARTAAEMGDNSFNPLAREVTNRLKPEAFGQEK